MPRAILIVDDSAMNRMVLKQILRNDYSVTEAEDGEEALAILRRMDKSFAAILLDLIMPVMDGYRVLEQLRKSPVLSRIPVIVITASSDGEAEVRALRLGASDFVAKPYNPEILLRRLEHTIKLCESSMMISAIQNDKLTGLYNREPFFFAADELIAGQESGYYVVSAIDIDKFSLINDQYSIAKGDEVLRRFADALDQVISPSGGICCRMTADNFAVIFPAEKLESETVLETGTAYLQNDKNLPPLTFSIGRCIVTDKTTPVSTLYDHAFLAKTTVKGRYDKHIAMYDESMLQNALRTQKIVDEMKSALDGGQFEAWFQPQFNNINGKLVGAEALARWRHPENGLVPPGLFISVFEQNGFIYELDKCIWEQTCAFLRRCLDEDGKALPISVNISRYDVFRADLIDELTGLTRKYALPIDLLRLEITESAFSGGSERITQVINKLVEIGFTVEIDDFGSGYSSLNTLKDVPAQIIKLDLRFLEGGNNLERGGSIIESMVRMARWLGMSIIAEGVETSEQAKYLRSIGCNYSQGYYFARPMPGSDYRELIKNSGRDETLNSLTTVENLDNNAFWDPASVDTMIFNSYVGAGCILEFNKGRIFLLRATDAFAKILTDLGVSLSDAMRVNWCDYMSVQDICKFSDGAMESVETRENIVNDYEFNNLPGCPETVCLRTHMRVIALAGDRYMLYCLNEDITAQRQAERNQRSAERKEREAAERLSAIMSHMGAGVTAANVDSDGRMRTVFANDFYYAMLGYTKEEYEAEVSGPTDVIVAEDLGEVLDAMSGVIESGRNCEHTYRVRKRDGGIMWVRCRSSRIPMEGLGGVTILRVMTDITGERLNARKLSEAEQVQAIIRSLNGGIAATTIENSVERYIFMNDQYCSIFGYTREQFISELPVGLSGIVLPEDAEKLRAINSGDSAIEELRVRHRDGGEIYVNVRSSVSALKGFKEPVRICVLHDVTQEKAVRKRLETMDESQKHLINDIPGGFLRMCVGKDGRVVSVSVNDDMCALVGAERADFGLKCRENPLWAVHPDDVSAVKGLTREAMESGSVQKATFRLRREDGTCESITAYIRKSDGDDGMRCVNVYATAR